MWKRMLLCGVWTLSLLSPISVSAATITFFDDTFDLATLTPSVLHVSDPAIDIALGQCVCGNPGEGLGLGVFMPFTGSGLVAVGFVNDTWVYDPLTQGPIVSLGASVDKDLTVDASDLGGFPGPFGNTFRPLVFQDGSYYVATIAGPPLPGIGSTGFNTISNPFLTAADFTLYDFAFGEFGVGNPDFGQLMTFGIAQVSSTVGLNLTDAFIGAAYDNLEFRINDTPAVVPEPSTWLLLGTGLVAVAVGRRRSRR